MAANGQRPKKQLILNAFCITSPGHLAPGLWKHPRNNTAKYKTIKFWTDLAQLIDNAGFHALVIADVLGGGGGGTMFTRARKTDLVSIQQTAAAFVDCLLIYPRAEHGLRTTTRVLSAMFHQMSTKAPSRLRPSGQRTTLRGQRFTHTGNRLHKSMTPRNISTITPWSNARIGQKNDQNRSSNLP